jgi:hypothetical protein
MRKRLRLMQALEVLLDLEIIHVLRRLCFIGELQPNRAKWGACSVSSSRKRRARARSPTPVARSTSISADASITIKAVS